MFYIRGASDLNARFYCQVWSRKGLHKLCGTDLTVHAICQAAKREGYSWVLLHTKSSDNHVCAAPTTREKGFFDPAQKNNHGWCGHERVSEAWRCVQWYQVMVIRPKRGC